MLAATPSSDVTSTLAEVCPTGVVTVQVWTVASAAPASQLTASPPTVTARLCPAARSTTMFVLAASAATSSS